MDGIQIQKCIGITSTCTPKKDNKVHEVPSTEFSINLETNRTANTALHITSTKNCLFHSDTIYIFILILHLAMILWN